MKHGRRDSMKLVWEFRWDNDKWENNLQYTLTRQQWVHPLHHQQWLLSAVFLVEQEGRGLHIGYCPSHRHQWTLPWKAWREKKKLVASSTRICSQQAEVWLQRQLYWLLLPRTLQHKGLSWCRLLATDSCNGTNAAWCGVFLAGDAFSRSTWKQKIDFNFRVPMMSVWKAHNPTDVIGGTTSSRYLFIFAAAMMMSTVRAAVLAALLSVTHGFAPIASSNVRRGSSLSMSAALIVQNKGGGHGELGTSWCLVVVGYFLLPSHSHSITFFRLSIGKELVVESKNYVHYNLAGRRMQGRSRTL